MQALATRSELSPLLAALENDLNTPEAFAELHALAGRLRDRPFYRAPRRQGRALAGAHLVGFLGAATPRPGSRGRRPPGLKARIDAMIAQRIKAREAKDWATADRIRAELAAAGVVLEDGPKGTSWRRVG